MLIFLNQSEWTILKKNVIFLPRLIHVKQLDYRVQADIEFLEDIQDSILISIIDSFLVSINEEIWKVNWKFVFLVNKTVFSCQSKMPKFWFIHYSKKPKRMGAKWLNTLNEKICQWFGIIVWCIGTHNRKSERKYKKNDRYK